MMFKLNLRPYPQAGGAAPLFIIWNQRSARDHSQLQTRPRANSLVFDGGAHCRGFFEQKRHPEAAKLAIFALISPDLKGCVVNVNIKKLLIIAC